MILISVLLLQLHHLESSKTLRINTYSLNHEHNGGMVTSV